MPGHALPPSARRDFLDNHDRQLRDSGRDRPFIPSSLTDLDDVIDDQGVLAGQAVHYDPTTGLYLHRSRQIPFGSGSGPFSAGLSTGLMELPYDGDVTTFVVLLKAAGSSDTILNLLYNGGVLATAVLGSGVSRVQYGIDPAQPVIALSDTLEVEVVTAASDAAGLSGYVLA